MQENKTKARNNSLDIVKFIAALLVEMTYHQLLRK